MQESQGSVRGLGEGISGVSEMMGVQKSWGSVRGWGARISGVSEWVEVQESWGSVIIGCRDLRVQ